MDLLNSLIGDLLSVLAIGPVLWLFLVALGLYVMTRNWQRLRHESPPVPLREGEERLATFAARFPLMRVTTVLTSERMIQLRLSWFLSKRKLKVLPLDEVHSIVVRRSMNWLLLLAGLYLLGTLNPVALLLVVLAFQARLYSVKLDTPFAQMPWTRMAVSTPHRAQLPELMRFYAAARRAWIAAQTGSRPVKETEAIQPMSDPDFRWGPVTLASVCTLMVAAVAQRVLEPHVSFDSYLFMPLYLGVPVALAIDRPRDAGWAALIGMVGLFTVKFPSTGLMVLFTGDGTAPALGEYAIFGLTMLVTVLLAAQLAKVHHALGFVALFAWLPVIYWQTESAFDTAFYAKLLLAMAASLALVDIVRAVWPPDITKPDAPAPSVVHDLVA